MDYTGVDITPDFIEIAHERFPGVPFLVGDARSLPFEDKSFDTVLCFFVLVHLNREGVALAMKELTRVARKQVLLAGYFSQVRVYGQQKTKEDEFIYDSVGFDELKVPGWKVFGHVEEEPKAIRVPSINEEGERETVYLECRSFIRLVRA